MSNLCKKITIHSVIRTYLSNRTDERQLVREKTRTETYLVPRKLLREHPLHIALSIHRANESEK